MEAEPFRVMQKRTEATEKLVEEIYRLSIKLDEESYESREEFREDLKTLRDKVSLLKARV
jgi:hypothetical protein